MLKFALGKSPGNSEEVVSQAFWPPTGIVHSPFTWQGTAKKSAMGLGRSRAKEPATSSWASRIFDIY